ncbi:MAG TPA: hypothetical protein PLU64_15570, partial [Saprospiraceae bacterium]|nr:hypothetical protein [Saprospiraceae bacterium]
SMASGIYMLQGVLKNYLPRLRTTLKNRCIDSDTFITFAPRQTCSLKNSPAVILLCWFCRKARYFLKFARLP